MDTVDPKRLLRRRMRAVRRTVDDARRLSEAAAERALALPELAAAQLVLCYVSVRSELPTEPLLRALLASGRGVAIPRVEGEALRARRLQGLDDLCEGAYGIPTCDGEDVSDLVDLCVTPGLAFSPSGGRIGYGGGYYDRFFAMHPRALPVGYAYEEQIVEFVPMEPHDRRMALIVTPERVVRPGSP